MAGTSALGAGVGVMGVTESVLEHDRIRTQPTAMINRFNMKKEFVLTILLNFTQNVYLSFSNSLFFLKSIPSFDQLIRQENF